MVAMTPQAALVATMLRAACLVAAVTPTPSRTHTLGTGIPDYGAPYAATESRTLMPVGIGIRAPYAATEPRTLTPGTDIRDYGAPYAATEPLVGHTIDWSWADKPTKQLLASDCAKIAAATERHGFYFNKAEDGQQVQQRVFLESVPTKLCAKPEQTEDEYTEILHGLLEAARKGNTLHTHAAFWLKVRARDPSPARCMRWCSPVARWHAVSPVDACGGPFSRPSPRPFPALQTAYEGVDGSYDAQGIYDVFLAGVGANDTTYYTAENGTKLSSTFPALMAVMNHEKYNLAEGFYFLNMTMQMLSEGASFCLDADIAGKVARMSEALEARMAYHGTAKDFDELLDAIQSQVCTLADTDKGLYEANYYATVEMIDQTVLSGTHKKCSYPVSYAEHLSYLRSNPPDESDLIMTIEGNTKLTISAAAHTVQATLDVDGTCLDSTTAQPDPIATARIAQKLRASGLPRSLFPQSRTIATAHPMFTALPSVYHKLGSMCVALSANLSNVCVDSEGNIEQTASGGVVWAGEVDMNPIMDLVTSTDIAKCSGEACKAAARAVVAYQAMLGHVTQMRWDMVQVAMGVSGSPSDPQMGGTTWTFQRSCAAFERIVDQAIYLTATLPTVVRGLRQVEPQLEAACVAPARSEKKFPLISTAK